MSLQRSQTGRTLSRLEPSSCVHALCTQTAPRPHSEQAGSYQLQCLCDVLRGPGRLRTFRTSLAPQPKTLVGADGNPVCITSHYVIVLTRLTSVFRIAGLILFAAGLQLSSVNICTQMPAGCWLCSVPVRSATTGPTSEPTGRDGSVNRPL